MRSQFFYRFFCVAIIASLSFFTSKVYSTETAGEDIDLSAAFQAMQVRLKPVVGLSETQAKGKAVFKYWCTTCHGDGPHRPGTMALAFKYNGEVPALLELRNNLSEELLRYFIRNGVSVMPSFRPTEVSDADIEAMAEYLSFSAASQGHAAKTSEN